MFEWLTQPLRRSKRKAKELSKGEASAPVVEGKAPKPGSADSLRSLLKTAITDAEQISASIKMRAQAEAEAEADRIIAQAKLESQEIKGEYERTYSRLSSSLQDLMNEVRNIEMDLKGRVAKLLESRALELKGLETMLLSTAEVAVPPIETSAPAETELKPDISSAEKVEVPVRLEAEALEEKVEVPVQLEAEALEERKAASVELDSQALYTGEVELIIVSPVELKLISRLYNYLQTVPELRILYTRGSWDQGTTIIVVLDNPLPLISIILETPDVKVIPELLEREGVAAGKSSSLLRGGEQRVKRIKLILKEA